MKAVARWKSLGWRHPVWDLLRFYLSLRGVNKSNEWLTDLRKDKVLSVDDGTTSFPVDPTHIKRFVEYLDHRDKVYKGATDLLRSEEEALAYCKAKVIEVTKTTTKSLEHHQSSKAMVATVSTIGEKVCQQFGYDIEPNPQTRCVCVVPRKGIACHRSKCRWSDTVLSQSNYHMGNKRILGQDGRWLQDE